ncbi:tyrosyl-DNA phosphodiesterase 2-like isoform X1 [Schistocerca gregaria]|uniref:tyrosyl-DNA phosphodiesterase 2-like isoform X1 n=1 Tax=Schistocerca gregaria TaxID=7010 RepID=UPI00211EE0D7|nr:tyrosyl-DNA phosphodiesterase 2-like isoform X1 [Schistocerca gregaria]XP_049857289.1 tyrosyl-DNA phosphodiesterase 2-like isoform X1 [Schistocerca gregaria]XP_049857298.1 tyrosyl-DNA phosphodiesterase 2-like isoform X1 [Schistocerca gregaria]XP_049857307.1 tyrosyl-DNA phosphodiesterase 2-like isoform X1 [Schistocerca gregaria]XP_049857318.1 tyrosyl-DNA phosphodiesterase 2-like isoform X1 [Schistocerca gregaria]XP_049857326.1 tyrosyl-DNA phosphodiesterase 2-like isoform X1 [Schistocerca gre
MSNSEDEDIPDRETCQKLTEQFAEITGTDVACAQFYLQDRKWDLQRSVNAFFESTQKGGINFTNDGDTPEIVINVDKKMVTNLGMMTTEPPSKFKLFSWNIDGLSEHNLKIRTKAVCKTIQFEKPDIIFLQEVIPETLNYIKDKLPEYVCIAGNTEGYFVATFLRRFTVYYDSHRVVEFPSSLMMRNYIAAEAHIGPLNLLLINTHLESTADHVAERINQLKRIFQEMLTCPEERVVICGGDLNLREKDLTAAGGLPPGVDDLWISCGSRKTCQYTWDMLRNTNVEFPGKYKPRFRFDRLYLRNSHQKSVVPQFFGLVGIEKVTRTQSYPSDHWGIQVHFTIEKR